jgi:hypothetical protein
VPLLEGVWPTTVGHHGGYLLSDIIKYGHEVVQNVSGWVPDCLSFNSCLYVGRYAGVIPTGVIPTGAIPTSAIPTAAIPTGIIRCQSVRRTRNYYSEGLRIFWGGSGRPAG